MKKRPFNWKKWQGYTFVKLFKKTIVSKLFFSNTFVVSTPASRIKKVGE